MDGLTYDEAIQDLIGKANWLHDPLKGHMPRCPECGTGLDGIEISSYREDGEADINGDVIVEWSCSNCGASGDNK